MVSKYIPELETKGWHFIETFHDENDKLLYKLACSKGHIHIKSPSHLKNIVRCDACTIIDRKEQINQSQLTLLSDENLLTLRKNKLSFKCDQGHITSKTFDNFVRSPYCTICRGNISRGELIISNLLTTNQIPFQAQYRITNPKTQLQQFFDFVVFRPNNIPLVIEYDGQHHFKAINYGDNVTNLKKIQEHDRFKNQYAKKHRMEMFRIPYTISTPFDIYKMLLTKLNLNFDYHENYFKTNNQNNQIIEFYKHHSIKETCQKFKVNNQQVYVLFKSAYSMSKKEHERFLKGLVPKLSQPLKRDVVRYYLKHSIADTERQYKVTKNDITASTQELLHCSKSTYLESQTHETSA